MNLPTALTLGRLGVIPIVIIVYYLPFYWAHPVAAILFILAAITDWLDGYLARTLKQMSSLGAFLDPVADKLLVGMVLIIIVGNHQISFLEIPAAIIVGREITISALREWMAELGKRASMAVSLLAKFKTALQLVAIIILLWAHKNTGEWFILTGVFLLYGAAILTLWSMANYLRLAWRDLTLANDT